MAGSREAELSFPGVSTRWVENLVDALVIARISRMTSGRICMHLKAQVETFAPASSERGVPVSAPRRDDAPPARAKAAYIVEQQASTSASNTPRSGTHVIL